MSSEGMCHYNRWFSSLIFAQNGFLFQCLIPVIEGLFNPSIEKIIIPLILKLSIVYNLAYLDQQTERTIRLLDREIGEFSRLALSLSKQAHSLSDSTRLTSPDKNIPMYAYATPKFHMLGHLTASIRRLGPLDNFTTAFVSVKSPDINGNSWYLWGAYRGNLSTGD